MEGGREVAENDADKIGEADSKLKTDIAGEKLNEAASEAQSDIELLNEYTDLSRKEREESQQLLDEYSQRIEQAKGA